MKKLIFHTLIALAMCSFPATPAFAASKAQLERDAQAALEELYKSTPGAKVLAESARGVLIFPSITKGGFVVAGQYGEGVMFKDGVVEGYYNTTSASFGFQAGLQKFGYALFFMTDSDLEYAKRTEGWELGVGPSITIVDEGLAASISTTTGRSGIFAFFFGQKGLMGGVGIQGTKVSRIHPD